MTNLNTLKNNTFCQAHFIRSTEVEKPLLELHRLMCLHAIEIHSISKGLCNASKANEISRMVTQEINNLSLNGHGVYFYGSSTKSLSDNDIENIIENMF